MGPFCDMPPPPRMPEEAAGEPGCWPGRIVFAGTQNTFHFICGKKTLVAYQQETYITWLYTTLCLTKFNKDI